MESTVDRPVAEIIDTTLRDGEQAPGVVFSKEEKLNIAILLDKLGIEEIEAGIPALSKNERDCMKTIVDLKLNARISMWCRALKNDIDEARETGCDRIHIAFPLSAIHLKAMGKDYQWLFKNAKAILNYASEYFQYISIGAQDAGRTETEAMRDFLLIASSFNPTRLRIADTVGVLNPFTVDQFIRTIKSDFPNLPLEFHGHNDLGMATANSIAAIYAGANYVSTTVNGIGERAGNAATEEVVMALKYSMNYDNYYHTSVFDELTKYVSHASGIPIPLNKAITGERVMMHESGIHTHCQINNKHSFQLIEANAIGREESDFVFGKHSGSAALIEFFRRRSIPVNRDKALMVLSKVKNLSEKLKRQLSAKEVEYLYEM